MAEDADEFLEELAQFDRPALQTQIANHSMSTNHSATFDRGSGSEDALLPRLGGSGARRRPTTGTAASQSQNGASAARLAGAGGDTGARDREREQRRKEKKEKKEKRERKAKEREERDARRAERGRAAAGADDGDVGSGVDEEAAAAEAQRQRIERHWQCPECRTLNARRTNKCRCGFDRELGTGSWLCPGCAILNQPQDGSSANFCPSCGHKRPEDSHAVGEVCEDVVDLTAESRATLQDSLSRKPSVIEVPPPRAAAGAPEGGRAGDEADEDLAMLGLGGQTQPTRLAASDGNDNAEADEHFSDSDEEGSSDSDSDYDSSDVDSAASWSESEADTENHPENQQSAEEQVASLTRSLAESSTGANVVPANPPATMVDAGLKPFQLQGLQWMLDREADTLKLQFRGGLLADLMGMGKTRMLISLIEATRHAQTAAGAGVFLNRVRSYGTLIVCPLSLMSQWVQEIRHTVKDKVRVLRYHGPRAKRLSIFDVAEQFDVVLTTYQTLACEFRAGTAHRPSKLHSIEWYRVILDEAHNIRNPRSRQSRACVHLNGGRRWAVTATPLQNSLNDFHPIAKFLNIPGFGFRAWWIANVTQDPDDGTKRLQVIFSKMMLRRTFNTPGPDGQPLVVLPRKEIHTHKVEMDPEERAFYKEVFWWAKRRVDAANRNNVNPLLAFATGLEMLVRCRQAANHKCLAVMAMQKKMGVDTTNSRQPNAQRRSPTTANPAGQQQPPVATTVTVEPTLEEALQKAQREADEALSAEAQARAAAKAALEAFIKKVKPKMLRSEFVDQVLDKLLENEGKLPEDEECTICMDAMTNPCVLRCGHTFCGECVVQSLEHQPRCPQCRTQVSPKQCYPLPGAAGGPSTGGGDEEGRTESLAAAERRRRRAAAAAFSSEDSDEESKILPRLESFEIGPMSDWQPSAKIVRILEIIRAAEPDEKFVVMSHFTTFLRTVAAVLEREEISHVMYHGGLDVRERDKVVRRFHVPHVVAPSGDEQQQQGADAAQQAPPTPAGPPPPAAAGARQRNSLSPGPRVMLATIQSCGVGLNLCAASQLIVTDPSWNPAIESQAYSRIHRIGQTRDVKIHRLIADGTIDNQIQELAESKANVADLCMDSSRAARLGRQELMQLFGGERRRRRRRDREAGDELDDQAPPEQPRAEWVREVEHLNRNAGPS